MNDMPICSNRTKRKARKDHKCTNCRCEIKSGTEYTYISGIWNGEPESFKLCENCRKVIDNFELIDKDLAYDEGPGLDRGGISCWLQDFIYAGWKGEEAANDIAKLFDVPLDYARDRLGLATKQRGE